MANEKRTVAHATLIIMAAGMGSRYGGNKQIDGIGPSGEILMEYSIHDAIKAGFDKIVFIIKPEMEGTLHNLCGARIAKEAEVSYAFQTYDSIPVFYTVPQERTKPFGTVHALLAARGLVNTPFAILNADDYYGVDAFKTMYDAITALPGSGEACMMGYRLKNTVSENGTVTRGVCEVENGRLVKVKETYQIKPLEDGTIWDGQAGELDSNALVSMNFWGFTPWIFDVAQEYFEAFLRGLSPNELKAECLLPTMVDDMMRSGKLNVNVLSTDSQWFGVTYQEDKAKVQKSLKKLHAAGVYPVSLRK